jgi:hypothetical protein
VLASSARCAPQAAGRPAAAQVAACTGTARVAPWGACNRGACDGAEDRALVEWQGGIDGHHGRHSQDPGRGSHGLRHQT